MEVARSSALDVLDVLDAASPDCDDDDSGYTRPEGDDAHENRALVDLAYCRGPTRRPASARELFAIHGEATGTSRSGLSKKTIPVKRRPTSATPIQRKANGGSNQNSRGNGVDADTAFGRHEEETRTLRDQLVQLQRELDHAREERDEVQLAFRRLDQEIGNGYNLTERKEKEMRIGELLTKNQKLSQMLEKELKSQETLRASNNDLQSQIQSLEQQATLVNQVLSSVESKYIALVEANEQLTRNHAVVQARITSLQDELMQTQSRVADSQRNVDYEEKLRLWEAKYGELQRKLDAKNAVLRAEQERTRALELAVEKALEEKDGLEQEVAAVHGQMIKMQGAMTSMEARVEANAPQGEQNFLSEKIKQRVRLLEEELLSKNRLIADLKESIGGVFTVDSSQTKSVRRRRTTGVNRADTIANRVVSLTQSLRKAEETRDHKARCLDVLMAALPTLLQQLDALQDKFQAAVESNAILSNAVEQLQGPEQDPELLQQPAVTLARERYLLSGPYQPELLMGYTLSRAFSEVAVAPNARRQTKFMPFQVRTMARTSTSEATNSHGSPQVVIAADSDDPSGAAFLNRSKINAFLHFLQAKAAKTKATPLLMQRIADLLSAQRELMHQTSTESGFYKALVARLESELQQLKRKLHHTQNDLDRALQNGSDSHSARPNSLLLKLIEAVTGSPQPKRHTFVTQHEDEDSSDILVLDARKRSTNSVSLDLSDCNVGDEDLESVLLKLSVSDIRVDEIDLSDNEIRDGGAATLAAFLETSSLNVRVISLRGNEQITPEGLARIRTALMRNRRVHRVDVDESRQVLHAVAAEYEFDTVGRPLVLLEVRLPQQAFAQYNTENRQEESVQTMIQQLETMGYCDTVANLSRAEAVYRQAPKKNPPMRRVPAKSVKSTKPAITTVKPKALHPHQSQQERKFRALEDAIRRADESSTRVAKRASETRGISITQMQHLLQHPSRSASVSTSGAFSSHRISKLQFAQSHLAMVRRLSQKQG